MKIEIVDYELITRNLGAELLITLETTCIAVDNLERWRYEERERYLHYNFNLHMTPDFNKRNKDFSIVSLFIEKKCY